MAKTSILANADINLVLTCYILPAQPLPAPACFARHHTPQQAVAWQGLWRLGHHRLCNVRVAYTCIARPPPMPILQAPRTPCRNI